MYEWVLLYGLPKTMLYAIIFESSGCSCNLASNLHTVAAASALPLAPTSSRRNGPLLVAVGVFCELVQAKTYMYVHVCRDLGRNVQGWDRLAR